MNATPMNPEQQRRAERRARIERWNALVRRSDAAALSSGGLAPSLRPHAAKARGGASSRNPVRDTDDSERALILAEERGRLDTEEATTRENAIIGFRDVALNAAYWRTRAYVVGVENCARAQFELRPKVEQKKILRDAVRALHRLLTKGFPQHGKRFPHRGLSVRPQDLYSGVHVSDVLHLLQQHPRLWRLIVREGLTTGALLFAQCDDVRVTLADPNWWPGYPFDPHEPKNEREINACLAAMDGPYPETLPESSWLKSGC